MKKPKKQKDLIKRFLKNINIKNLLKNKHKGFVDVLFNKNIVREKIKRIRSSLHKTGPYEVCRISLPCLDDKRYMLDDDINNLADIHKDIFKIKSH